MPTHEECCEIVAGRVAAFAATVRGADPETPVPTCGTWKLRQLVHHTGVIHRWVEAIVRTRSTTRLSRRLADHPLPPTAVGQAEWLLEGGEALAKAWQGADPAERVWTWGPGRNVGWWSRRMVHETGVHHCDALLATGAEPAVPAEVAADGVGEFLGNLRSAGRWSEGVRTLRGTGERLHLAATDIAAEWVITLGPDGFTYAEGSGGGAEGSADGAEGSGDGAEVRAEGAATDLYLAVWGRLPPARLRVTGDEALLARWLENTAI
jgi:uncharacterized protein (TIGR03083 family)